VEHVNAFYSFSSVIPTLNIFPIERLRFAAIISSSNMSLYMNMARYDLEILITAPKAKTLFYSLEKY